LQDRSISAKKLLYWIENNTEAEGFWDDDKSSVASFDKLEDAINSGQLDSDDSRLKLNTEAVKCPSCGATTIANLEDRKLPDVSWLKCNWCGDRPVIAEWKRANPILS